MQARGKKKGQSLMSESAPSRGTVDFVDYAADCVRPCPSYWTKQDGLDTADGKTEEAIEEFIVEEWNPRLVGRGRDARGLRKCGIEVISVERLENPQLFSHYFEARKEMFEECSSRGRLCPAIHKLPGSAGSIASTETLPDFMTDELYWEVNEHYLFHGTKPENIQQILSHGLNPKHSSPHSMFGKAIYTTESFMKADQYTDPKHARSRLGTELYMILARVLLGRVYVCDDRDETSSLNAPPRRFDSIMADGEWMFREFAVHQKHRCYPEYVITYRRTK